MLIIKEMIVKIKWEDLVNFIRKLKILRYKKSCLDEEDFQKVCNSYILRYVIHEMYLQHVKNQLKAILMINVVR